VSLAALNMEEDLRGGPRDFRGSESVIPESQVSLNSRVLTFLYNVTFSV